ncbi:LuxR C-terminal-related transcriptional regulator [Nonomuraea sp. NPDC046570]|uniref:ATP-binding protein n=1 Tax=Nonomuraea sp. NPDC046570 TaxID=3155255 RepID=UPI00340DD551
MTTTGPGSVSRREAQVLEALGEQLSNSEIAGRLHISVRTVESHVSSLLRKHGVADRRSLADLGRTVTGEVAGLPAALTTFVGRAGELERVLAAFDDARLVTLSGPGGVGKTRLAAVLAETAAASFPSGRAFVDLVPVRDGFVAQAVAAALGVTEHPRQPLEYAIAERLGRGRSLLVLDNCEHLLDAVARFAERLLAACPGTRILVTSRERLAVAGERIVRIAPLPLSSDAEVLFHDRATAADPDFAADPGTVTDICARLDGMPLAIELAAARVASLGVEGLLAALEDILRLLSGARRSDERHRSLRAVIGWSYNLLDEEERRLLCRLAAFAGGFDLAAAVAVTPDGTRGAVADVLGRLVDKSLVTHGAAGRWRLLDTVRAFAADRLADGDEQEEVRRRHLSWAEATATDLTGRLDGEWRDDFDAVADDLRAALAAAPPGPDAIPHRLARALARLTYARRFLMESLDRYQQAAQRAPTPGEAARDLRAAANCARVSTTSGPQVFELLLASAEQARAAGDGDAQAIGLALAVERVCRSPATFPTEIPHDRLCRLLDEATAAGDARDPVVAACLATAAAWTAGPEKSAPDPGLAALAFDAARVTGDPVLISASLDAMSTAAGNAGRLREANRHTGLRFAQLALMDRTDPYSATEIIDILATAAADAIMAGDLPAALLAARRILDDDLLGNHSYISAASQIPALVLTGDLDPALRYASAMWDGWQRAGRPPAGWMSPAVATVALAYGLLGEERRFRLWRARVLEVAGITDARHHLRLAPIAFVDARIAVHTGDLTDAALLVERAFAAFPASRYGGYARAAGAELAVVAGLPDAPERLAHAAAAADQNDWAAACVARATGRLHGDADALAASADGWERIGARLERACTLRLLPAPKQA